MPRFVTRTSAALVLSLAATAAWISPAALAASARPATASPAATAITGSLSGVAATSASNAWAVGTAGSASLTLHWNGHSWTRVSAPGQGLSGVAASSASNVMGGGRGRLQTADPALERPQLDADLGAGPGARLPVQHRDQLGQQRVGGGQLPCRHRLGPDTHPALERPQLEARGQRQPPAPRPHRRPARLGRHRLGSRRVGRGLEDLRLRRRARRPDRALERPELGAGLGQLGYREGQRLHRRRGHLAGQRVERPAAPARAESAAGSSGTGTATGGPVRVLRSRGSSAPSCSPSGPAPGAAPLLSAPTASPPA